MSARPSDAISVREERVLGIIETARAKRGKFRDAHVTMAHGAGGKAPQGLIEGLLVPALGGPSETLAEMGDAGAFRAGGARLAMTTDAFVVKPLRFPGGSIGDLAVNGTVNDLAMGGARPLALSMAFVLEEGLAVDDLRRVVASVARAAQRRLSRWSGSFQPSPTNPPGPSTPNTPSSPNPAVSTSSANSLGWWK